MNNEYAKNMIQSAQDRDYLKFKQNFDNLLKEKLDNHYENRTKELYQKSGNEE